MPRTMPARRALPLGVAFISLLAAVPAIATQPQSPDRAKPGPATTAASGDAGAYPSPDQATKLEGVEVEGIAPYRVSDGNTATRTDTPIIDVPQSIEAIPRQVLDDQNAHSLEAAIRNAPGIYVQQGEGNRDEFYLRGVKTKSDFFMDGLRDDSEYYRPLYNVAHVDVLQGPAAILFGRGGAGGIINLVTRQAVREPIRHVSFGTGSWDQRRGAVDFGGAVGTASAFRIMAMGEDSGSFRDHVFLHRYAINPKFTTRIGNDTELDVSLSYLDDERRADRGIPSRNGRPADVDRGMFFGSLSVNRNRSRVRSFSFRVKHRISDALKFRNAFLVTDNDRFYRNVYPGSAITDDGSVKLKAYYHPSNRLSYLERAEMVAHVGSGAVRHTLLGGVELGWQRGDDYQTLPSDDSKTIGRFPLTALPFGDVAFPYLDRDNHVIGRETGLYLQDQLHFGERWIAMAGVRWDRFSVTAHYHKPGVDPDHSRRVDSAFSPRVGLIYKPVTNDSIYASVTRTFTPQGANIALSQKSPKTADLDPETATNYEIGNKLDLLDGNLSITAALFQLELKNVVSKAADGSGRLVNTGTQRNRGAEISVEGSLTSRWNLYANYTHLDAVITSATKDAAAGARVGLVPRDQASIWTTYAFNRHWGIGCGVRGASMKYTSYDNDVVLPGYAVADAMAYYQGDGFRVQLNFDNLSDRRYYATASGDNEIMPGTPRSVGLSLDLDF